MSGGAPKGNKNNTKTKAWEAALRRELTGNQNADKLARIAKKVVEMATDGDMKAIKEIGDRLDGKPIQAVEGSGNNGEITLKITSDDASIL